MALSLLSAIETLKERMEALLSEQKEMEKQIRELTEENLNLKKSLEEKEESLKKAATDIEYLTVSHKLAEAPDTIIMTRRKIAGMIRTIDTCISLLKE